MNKKIKIIIGLAGFALLVLFSWFFLMADIGRFPKEKTEVVGYIRPREITGDKELDKIIYEGIAWHWIYSHSLEGPIEKQMEGPMLVNLVRITKEDSEIETKCQLGAAHNFLNFEKFYPDELITMGRIQKCDKETAELTDKIARSPARDCRISLINPIPPYLNEYYLVTIVWRKEVVTQEIFNQMMETDRCFEPFKNLIGEKVPTIIIVGIIDRKGGVFYH